MVKKQLLFEGVIIDELLRETVDVTVLVADAAELEGNEDGSDFVNAFPRGPVAPVAGIFHLVQEAAGRCTGAHEVHESLPDNAEQNPVVIGFHRATAGLGHIMGNCLL